MVLYILDILYLNYYLKILLRRKYGYDNHSQDLDNIPTKRNVILLIFILPLI